MVGRIQAGEPAQSYTTIVGCGDRNLDSEQGGAKVLYARLRNAAENVCASLEGRDWIKKSSGSWPCRRERALSLGPWPDLSLGIA
jgi:UrcA family protein